MKSPSSGNTTRLFLLICLALFFLLLLIVYESIGLNHAITGIRKWTPISSKTGDTFDPEIIRRKLESINKQRNSTKFYGNHSTAARESVRSERRKVLTYIPLHTPWLGHETPAVFMISAFYDTRYLLLGDLMRIRIVTSLAPGQSGQLGFNCLVGIRNGQTVQVLQKYDSVGWPYQGTPRGSSSKYHFHASMVDCNFPVNHHWDLYSTLNTDIYVTLVAKQSISQSASEELSLRWILVEQLPNFPLPPLNVAEFSKSLRSENSQETMTICTAPLRGDIYATTLRTWIEFYRLMAPHGLKVILYDRTMGTESTKIVDEYARRNTTEVYRWIIPYDPNDNSNGENGNPDHYKRWISEVKKVSLETRVKFKERFTSSLQLSSHKNLPSYEQIAKKRFHSQVASSYDCVYRAVGARWMPYLDFDEYLTPHQQPNLIQLFQQAATKKSGITAAFTFLNIFHRLPCYQKNVNELVDRSMFMKQSIHSFLCANTTDCIGKLSNNTEVGSFNDACLFSFVRSPFRKKTPIAYYPQPLQMVLREPKFFKKGKRSKNVVDPFFVEIIYVHSPPKTLPVKSCLKSTSSDSTPQYWLLKNGKMLLKPKTDVLSSARYRWLHDHYPEEARDDFTFLYTLFNQGCFLQSSSSNKLQKMTLDPQVAAMRHFRVSPSLVTKEISMGLMSQTSNFQSIPASLAGFKPQNTDECVEMEKIVTETHSLIASNPGFRLDTHKPNAIWSGVGSVVSKDTQTDVYGMQVDIQFHQKFGSSIIHALQDSCLKTS